MRQSGGIKTEQVLVQECELFRRRHKYEKSSVQTRQDSHQHDNVPKGQERRNQPRVVTHEHAAHERCDQLSAA